MVFLKEVFFKNITLKNVSREQNHEKLPSIQKDDKIVKIHQFVNKDSFKVVVCLQSVNVCWLFFYMEAYETMN